jgi:hypothetical protein
MKDGAEVYGNLTAEKRREPENPRHFYFKQHANYCLFPAAFCSLRVAGFAPHY